MDFWSHFFQTLLDKWYVPIATAIIIGIFTGTIIKDASNTIKKVIVPLLLVILIPTFILTVVEDASDPEENVFIRNLSSSYNGDEDAGLASLYDAESMPLWFESYLTDNACDIALVFEINNIGKTYANIVHTKLIVDDFAPLTMDDVLLFRGIIRAGISDTVEATVDITNIEEGRSEYDVDFKKYIVNPDGKEHSLNNGESFYIDQSSLVKIVTSLEVNKSGIYKCHLSVVYEYYGKKEETESSSFSFIYLEDDERDYRFNKEKIDAFHIELGCEKNNRTLYYDIDGRTLRFHDSEIIFWDSSYKDFYRLIDTIIVEDGTIEMEDGAFNLPCTMDVSTIYLPKSLEQLDSNLFRFPNLKTIYFGGTKKQWISLLNNSKIDRFDLFYYPDSFEIFYDFGPMPTKEEELLKHHNEESYYELYQDDGFY